MQPKEPTISQSFEERLNHCDAALRPALTEKELFLPTNPPLREGPQHDALLELDAMGRHLLNQSEEYTKHVIHAIGQNTYKQFLELYFEVLHTQGDTSGSYRIAQKLLEIAPTPYLRSLSICSCLEHLRDLHQSTNPTYTLDLRRYYRELLWITQELEDGEIAQLLESILQRKPLFAEDICILSIMSEVPQKAKTLEYLLVESCLFLLDGQTALGCAMEIQFPNHIAEIYPKTWEVRKRIRAASIATKEATRATAGPSLAAHGMPKHYPEA